MKLIKLLLTAIWFASFAVYATETKPKLPAYSELERLVYFAFMDFDYENFLNGKGGNFYKYFSKTIPFYVVDVNQFERDIENNPVSGEKLYGGKFLFIKNCLVSEIVNKANGGAIVGCKMEDGLTTPAFMFDLRHKDQVAKISKGYSISLVGLLGNQYKGFTIIKNAQTARGFSEEVYDEYSTKLINGFDKNSYEFACAVLWIIGHMDKDDEETCKEDCLWWLKNKWDQSRESRFSNEYMIKRLKEIGFTFN